MKFSAAAFALAAAGTAAATPAQRQPPLSLRQARDARIPAALARLRRDPTGRGFAHLGADGVARAFDADLNVVDAVPVGSGTAAAAASFRREPGDEVRARLRDARSAAAALPPPVSRPRADDDDDDLLARQAGPKACNTIFCNSDEHCVGQKIYGYDCSNCFFVSETIGNCMQ